jgi:hypothetical protein
MKKGVKIPDMDEETNYGYTEEAIAATWKVCS